MRKPYDAPSKLSNVSHTQKRSRDGSKMTFEAAVMVEAKLIHGLDLLQQQLSRKSYYGNNHTRIQFPTTRECNAAIATLGSNPKSFMRGLQMFVKMRKAVSFYTKLNQNDNLLLIIPAPTLVTYSTLMSRAVSCNKPQVALRLWKLMTIQSNFFANCPSNITNAATNNIIVPDTKAANILMNVHAKLGDVLSAKALLQQMLSNSGGPDVPQLQPNLITYNTLIDACRRAGDLKTGLQLLQDMKLLSSLTNRTPIIQPDVRTYTSLISTVARKQLHKTTKLTFGTRDPDMAFALLYEMMQEQNLRPNGMTFCALIDVCGRCGRVDLALVGLRIMLRQQKQQRNEREEDDPISSVGAWTAAIDACGKAGRYNTAIRLFQSMESFGAKPNIVTCGCLVDCLLRAKEEEDEGEDNRANISTKTIRILESLLDLLRYMKENNMEPSEVMYTR
jgi:pentatricopeptide repeat protein